MLDSTKTDHFSEAMGEKHREEHQALEDNLLDLHRRAHGGDWSDLNKVWSSFCAMFDEHMREEEQEVFPAFLADHPDQEVAIRSFLSEHEELRALVDRLAMEIQLHEIRAESVDAFIERNRLHALAETERLYPWMDIVGPDGM